MSDVSLTEQQLLFRNGVLRVLESQRGALTEDEYWEVQHFINHDENGEALRTLAYILVEENKIISKALLKEIGELVSGLMAREEMPEAFREHMSNDT